MIIRDTDCLSFLERKSGAEYFELNKNLFRFDAVEITTTIVTFDEQMRGWMAFVARAKDTAGLILAYERLDHFLKTFKSIPLLSFDEEAGKIFDKLRKQKIRVGTMDLRIASIAISRNAILVSRNLVDFERIPGLTFEDWTKKSYIN